MVRGYPPVHAKAQDSREKAQDSRAKAKDQRGEEECRLYPGVSSIIVNRPSDLVVTAVSVKLTDSAQ